jgi:pimeloyl-ACP methyl ester carboxylesterase
VGGFDLVPDAPVLSMEQHALDVLRTMDKVGFESAVLVGCSIGGYVMLEVWRQAPERVRAMAFVCSKPQADAPAGRQKRAETIAKIRAEGVAGLFDAQAQTLVGASTRQDRSEISAEVRGQMLSSPEAVVAIQGGLATRPDSVPTVATIEVPVLAIAGGEDVAVSPAEMEAFRAAPGGCELHLLAHAGHFAAYEQPTEVGAMLAAWMKKAGNRE